jgi:hypothetical protein
MASACNSIAYAIARLLLAFFLEFFQVVLDGARQFRREGAEVLVRGCLWPFEHSLWRQPVFDLPPALALAPHRSSDRNSLSSASTEESDIPSSVAIAVLEQPFAIGTAICRRVALPVGDKVSQRASSSVEGSVERENPWPFAGVACVGPAPFRPPSLFPDVVDEPELEDVAGVLVEARRGSAVPPAVEFPTLGEQEGVQVLPLVPTEVGVDVSGDCRDEGSDVLNVLESPFRETHASAVAGTTLTYWLFALTARSPEIS